ncbi:alpha-2-macroglobulin-like protein 1 [Anopheles maculipalpis]|uniref:alpha-2-macroglobulin-like protein 1 n=1 Tax=Anopheles maculipalpis TaxID=1496333 RepID=UPI00215920F0|nr:alpha-2-macroglobulin-like protein 1 [Anopheles maculipalpis]
MAIKQLPFVVLFLAWGIPRDCAGQRYAILASPTVRPHGNYDLIVTNISPAKKEFKCEIVDSNDVPVGGNHMTVNPYGVRKVLIPVAALKGQAYKLKVWDVQSQSLVNSTELECIRQRYIVLFQTDKPAYKPGDRVQFRVIFLLPHMVPVTAQVLPDIFLTDPDRMRMKQWLNASLTSGVFEGSFQLAEQTTLGLWTISATLYDELYKESFMVEEYTLPLFKIETQGIPKPYFHCKDTNMSLKLRASYVHGGSVRGNATVVVRTNYNNYPSQTKEVARKELPINGMVLVNFPTDIVAKNCDEEHTVWFHVMVTESSTGITYNTTSTMTVHNSEGVTMEVLDGNDAFYPGLAMRFKVKVTTNLDEKPLVNRNIRILYRVVDEDQNDREELIPNVLVLQTNSNGILHFSINTTITTSEVNVEGSYKNQTIPLVFAYPMYEDKSLDYLGMNTRNAYHYFHRNIIVDLYSNVKLQRIYYVGYTTGRIATYGVHESSKPANNHQLVIEAIPLMRPRMKLLSYAMKEDGKILSSAIIIRFMSSYKPAFDITTTLTEPNSGTYAFNITTVENAFVGLLGVDERIMERSTIDNNISQKKLDKAMQESEDSSDVCSSYDSFGSVGVKVLTDGYLPDVGFVPHSFDELARAGTDSSQDYNTREDFPETWIWESAETSSGKALFKKSLPDTITTWIVTGFSVSQRNGLQLLQEPIKIHSKKRIFAQLHLPPSIKRFEEITAHCLVHNYGAAANVSVEVRPMLKAVTKLFLAEATTETIRIKLNSAKVGVLAVDVILRGPKGEVIDALRQTVPVRPEGLTKTVEDVRVLSFPKHAKQSFNLSLPEIRENHGVSSGEVTLSVIGSFLNLNLFDLEYMVKSSQGNGEENLLFLQTTMAIYDYLKNTKRLLPETQEKFLTYMEVAYQQMLNHRLGDGSYTIFKRVHQCGGVWFTASVLETFQKLSKYMPIEESVLNDGLNWLVLHSEEDGSFNESCTIVHPHIQRTGGKELSLAGSVLFAFIGSAATKQYEQLINKTTSLLLSSPIEDVYLLAKTTYLLTLLEHPESVRMLSTLNRMMVTDGKYRYWRVARRETTSLTREQEATAYALLANIKQNMLDQVEMIRVAQWLQKQSFAGDRCVPSLERVIALEALATVAQQIPSIAPSMYITVGNLKLEVNATNKALLQTVTLPKDTRSVSVSVRGSGLVLMKLSYQYSLSNSTTNGKTSNRVPHNGPISVNVKKKMIMSNRLVLNLCFSVVQPLYVHESDLWKAAIDLPTGYEIDEQQQRYDNTTKSTFLLNNNSQLELVWDVRHATEVCYAVTAITRWLLVDLMTGLIYLSSFDTKDIVAVYHF